MPEPAEVANVADSLAGGANREFSARERILLWVVASRFGVDELDSYEYVFPSPAPVTVGSRIVNIDGLVVQQAESGFEIVVLLYRAPVGRARVVSEVTALLNEGTRSDILKALARQSAALAAILERAKVSPTDEQLSLTIATVAPVSTLPKSATVSSTEVQVLVLDGRGLENLRNAITEPGPVPGIRTVVVRDSQLIETQAGAHRIVIAVVPALEVLQWPDIDTRRLFDLNVRLGLGMNRVRRSLDEAFSSTEGQENILAYHNGLTVLTNTLTVGDGTVDLDGISVVNGAQTLLALNENRSSISPDLCLLVKFVELQDAIDDAQEIAVRSNSQNPVTTRNLRALDKTQLRLRRELTDHGYDYETRPDRGRGAAHSESILQNDVVAQWLCAIYVEEPWLAVKRTSLFLQENYTRVFPADIPADRVVLAARIRQAIEAKKSDFPDAYHRAWSLSALVACYLVGQILRSSRDLARLLLIADVKEQDAAKIGSILDQVIDHVMVVFREHDAAAGGFNNYYVDFKSKQVLLRLAGDATRSWLASGQGQ